MKKVAALLLVLSMAFALCACGSEADSSVVPEPEKTSIEQLSEKERLLYDAVLDIVSDRFKEPSATRILEIGDCIDNSQKTGDDFGTETVVVRFQGTDSENGTVNGYYLICTVAADNSENNSMYEIHKLRYESAQLDVLLAKAKGTSVSQKTVDTMTKEASIMMQYKAEYKEFLCLGSDYTFTNSPASGYDIGKINSALKEHWDELGF